MPMVFARQKENIKLTRLETLHHGILIIIFPIISFVTIGMVWSSIESIFSFESKVMSDVFYWFNFGIVILVTSKLFVPMKLKFKYICILCILFLFLMPFVINYTISEVTSEKGTDLFNSVK